MFQTKVTEKIKTRILCSVNFFPENRAVSDIMWKNMTETHRPQMTIQYDEEMRFAYPMSKTRIHKHTHS
jgi:hypothetical protein